MKISGGRIGIPGGGGAGPLLLPIDQSLIIADWISDRGVAGTGSSVASWTDQVNGNVLSQASGPAQPTLVSGAAPSGRSAIRFDGLNDMLEQPAFDLSAVQDVAFFIVCVSNGVQENIVDFDGSNVRFVLFRRLSGEPRLQVNGNVGANAESDSDPTLLDTPRLYQGRAIISNPGANEAQGFVDSTLTRFDMRDVNNNNTDANMGSGPLRFGERALSFGGSNFFNGDLYRVAAVNVAADETAIAQFLSTTYGVP